MKPHRDDSLLPKNAIWSDAGTDPVADAQWLANFPYTDRHYRLYDSVFRRVKAGDTYKGILFGVLLIDSEKIEESHAGLLFPSPSMIGHRNAYPGRKTPLKPEAPLEGYFCAGGPKHAYRFGSDLGYSLDGYQIRETQMRWRWVRPLPPPKPIAHCSKCHGILATPLAKQCLHCGADWH